MLNGCDMQQLLEKFYGINRFAGRTEHRMITLFSVTQINIYSPASFLTIY